ncbi:MAG: hypothetical protein IPK04_16900 [Bdellovibrionales bacterium]|nr:hypothetical protein [Bdellovibrionales bacterium]
MLGSATQLSPKSGALSLFDSTNNMKLSVWDSVGSKSLQLNQTGTSSTITTTGAGNTNLGLQTAGGNVGIGTASPTNALSVIGNTNFTGTVSANGGILSGGGSVALGAGSSATSFYAVALGWNSTASSGYSTALGNTTSASGGSSTAMGQGSVASGQASIAMGLSSTAGGNYSMAVGRSATAPSQAQSTFGQYNYVSGTESATSWVTTDPLFVIGNGTAPGSLSNAMTVLKNGNVGIGTTTPQTALDVNGVIRVAMYEAQPFACDAAHDGSLALTSGYRHCVCKGGTTTWVFTSDGATSCTW